MALGSRQGAACQFNTSDTVQVRPSVPASARRSEVASADGAPAPSRANTGGLPIAAAQSTRSSSCRTASSRRTLTILLRAGSGETTGRSSVAVARVSR
jgi:hypothetical protein